MKIALILLLVLSATYTIGQKQLKLSALVGTYHFYNSDTTLHYFIRLDSNEVYYYSVSNDLVEKKSTGKWELFGDTLLLTSKYQIDNIGIKVTENTGPDSEVEFDGIKNLKGQLLPTALIFINGDTTKLCDPLAGDCKFTKGGIQTFNVIVGKITSTTYRVKNQLANKFSLVLNVDNYLDGYLFLKRSKFLVRGNVIYPLRNNEIDSIAIKTKAKVPIGLIRQ